MSQLRLIEGKDLPAMDYTGKSDPFIIVLLIDGKGKARQIYQTETIEQTLTPQWNENVRVKEAYLNSDNIAFRFNVYDRDTWSNDYMGHFEIPVGNLKKSFETWFPLLPKPGKKSKDISGSILVRCVAQSDAEDTGQLVAEATQKILQGDEKAAVPLLERASAQGNMAAQRDLAILLKDGRGHNKDPLEARRLFTMASKNGDPVSENNLGYMKQHGICGTRNAAEAKEHYEIAAEQDIPPALYNLGHAHFCGAGAQQDMEKGREYFAKAAFSNYPPALNNLAFCFQFGLGGDKNVEEAVKLFKQAADAGYPPAMANLGQYHQFVLKEEKKARELYEKALEIDNGLAQAWFSLALCLELGVGGETNLDQAKKAYEAAAKFGEPDGKKALDRLAKPPSSKRKSKRMSTTPKVTKRETGKGKGGLEVPAKTEKKGHRRARSMGGNKTAPSQQSETAKTPRS